MFLEQIAIETPEAATMLFELRDAGKWQATYRVSADWLDVFLRAVIEDGQEHMDWYITRFDKSSEIAAAATAAWLGTLTTYQVEQEMWRAIEKAAPDRIAYLDLQDDKRRVSRQCCWLVSWLFAGMDDDRIANASGVETRSIVGRTRRSFAETIKLKLSSRRGRRGAAKVVT